MDNTKEINIIGGGLAGCEAAWQAAQSGVWVKLYEMRPIVQTGAHISSELAELVCSNSLGSNLPDRASGVLKNELRQLGSLLLKCADMTSVPAGSALAVDRQAFAQEVTKSIMDHQNIQVIRQEIREIPPQPTIIATGPLTSKALSEHLLNFTGREHLFFYDAIAPIIVGESINMAVAYRASRFDRGVTIDGDYINCPLDKDQYYHFVESIIEGKKILLKEFEKDIERGVRAGPEQYFEGCLPIEILAGRGKDSLAFGPMRPIGLMNPHSGERPYAVIQLRQDNLAGSLYNMVGFQTNLTYPEQRRIFRMIPGLESVEFARYGQMHRNTFIYSPELLQSTLQSTWRDDLFFAGQITGVEGYMGNIATGLIAGLNGARFLYGEELLTLPSTTMLGALISYITQSNAENFQPMKANFGILPPIDDIKIQGGNSRKSRAKAYAERSQRELCSYLSHIE